MDNDLFYQLALTLVPHIGPVQAKILLHHFDVQDIFRAKKSDISGIEGIGQFRADQLLRFSGFDQVKFEMAFMQNRGIRPLFLTDPDYPCRLLHCYDPPTLLFYQGQVCLNHPRIIAIVGNKQVSEFGQRVINKLISCLAGRDCLLVTGSSVDIDAVCQGCALQNGVPIVALPSNSFEHIHSFNRSGVATELRSRAKAKPYDWLQRNRIVAGLCDAVVVIESDYGSGPMFTAQIAASYHREVFAVAGSGNDRSSAGCHYMIQTKQAIQFSSVKHLFAEMGWS